MSILLSTCLIIITVVFVFLALEIMDTMKQLKKTAWTIDKLAENANERLNDIQPTFQAVNSVTNAVTSGWGKLLASISGLFKKEE